MLPHGMRRTGLSGRIPAGSAECGRAAAAACAFGAAAPINPAVDCYNLISATFGVPAGAFDLSQVSGDIAVCFADGTKSFTPLGEPETVEYPRPGEVVYVDAAGVLTRHWNHRDAERTKVTADSDRIVFLLETVEEEVFGVGGTRRRRAWPGC